MSSKSACVSASCGGAAKFTKARAIHISPAQTLPKIYQQIEEWR